MSRSEETDRYRQALMLVRVMVGALFIFYGAKKVFGVMGGPGYSEWIAANQSYDPAFLAPVVAYLVPLIELLGGLGLLAGLLTRLSALGIALTMLGAVYHNMPEGFGPQGGWGFPLIFAILALALLIAGPTGGLDELVFGGSGEDEAAAKPTPEQAAG